MKNQLTVGQVYTLKFNSGEELITKITAIADGYLTVEDPHSIAPSAQGMGLVPSMFTADPSEKATININSVAMFSLTDDAIKMKYIEATTGIKVPEKKLILG